MNSKTCSVIVPIYNAAPYLAQCLSSIKMQTHKDLQVILVDDGSTDESSVIAQTFVDADTRFSLFQQPNQGQSIARNVGIKKAIGEYLVFVDADDYLDLDFVERHLTALGGADYVQSGYRRVNEVGDILEQKLPIHRYQFTVAWGRLYRTEWIKQHQIAFPKNMIYEDVVWSLCLWGSKPQVVMLDYVGYNYIYNPSSTTTTTHRDAQHKLMQIISQIPSPKWLKEYTKLRLLLHFSKISL